MEIVVLGDIGRGGEILHTYITFRRGEVAARGKIRELPPDQSE